MVVVPDPYRALNLPHTADDGTIKRSYRQLSKKYHPDTWSSPCFSDAERCRATEIFQKFSAAYALLADPVRKADYDRSYRPGATFDNDDGDDANDKTGDTQPREKGPANNDRKNNAAPPRSDPPIKPPGAGAPPPLPRGWTAATDSISRSAYYYHTKTGKSSWHHPSLAATTGGGTIPADFRRERRREREGDPRHDTYYNADDRPVQRQRQGQRQRQRPDNHWILAFLSLVLCLPLGIPATYHSMCVDRCWDDDDKSQRQQKDDEAQFHLHRVQQYACCGIVLGIAFWSYYFFGRMDEHDRKEFFDWWPDNGP